MKLINLVNAMLRFLDSLERPTRRANLRRLQQPVEDFRIREAVEEDVPALSVLHVRTWNETYPRYRKPPTWEVREHQWQEQFKVKDGSWFCFVVEDAKGKLAGFAKGITTENNTGELNKIYLLRSYQRLGLGRKLVSRVAQRFLDMGIDSMVLFGTPRNPSSAFHEALGGERLHDEKGKFQGGYYWKDLRKLV